MSSFCPEYFIFEPVLLYIWEPLFEGDVEDSVTRSSLVCVFSEERRASECTTSDIIF